jgi:hypothetical protein
VRLDEGPDADPARGFELISEYKVEIAIILVAILIAVILIVGFMMPPSEKKLLKIYAAWSLLYPQAKVPFEEWRLLWKEDLLPGQRRDDVSTGLAVGVAAGLALGVGRK